MSLYRNTVWLLKGLQEYTKGGYEAAARSFSEADLEVNVSGRSFIITGANSGIGKAAACEIAKRGGTVHLVCRNEDRANEARKDIVERCKNEINNAGCMVNQRELTEDGLEKNFATNTLGTYVLTTALIPTLKKSENPRVITVSSGGMLVQKLNVEDLQFEKGSFDGTMAYAQNKRQQVIMTEQWAAQHKEIHFSSMHPGWADTPAVQSSMPDFHAKMKNKLRTEAQGADTVVWLAISDAASRQPSGLFFQDRKAVSTHLPLASSRSSPAEEQKLMSKLEELAVKFKC
ncbi:dehydrogenase/reductase SDR family member 12-like [Sinocyclocheilus grahami]|uniref:dehydrogenase/reductase SDR family member 12-like n=1 Tax=Sinocyclocheilus grahami TaxID=75366 RepID=UPI0007ACC04D|nr:PREDICTED: dehydrogenase/reductase SDR family member 12-like [Sinocyclocheilus grahami]